MKKRKQNAYKNGETQVIPSTTVMTLEISYKNVNHNKLNSTLALKFVYPVSITYLPY